MAYTKPTPSNLKTRYPAFAAVADDTVQYWLTDAERFVGETWREADYAPALMACAAHHMAQSGVVGGAGALPQGVTNFKSGTFSAQISEAQAAKTGFETTRYGLELRALMRRNFAGPRLVRGC